MKIAKILTLIGGAANAVFFLFHLWLGWQIHKWPNLSPGLLALLEMLNGGGALFILLFAVASLACPADCLTTRLGRTMLVFVTALYCLRALAEIFVSPVFQPIIFIVCLATGLLYLAIFILACRSRR